MKITKKEKKIDKEISLSLLLRDFVSFFVFHLFCNWVLYQEKCIFVDVKITRNAYQLNALHIFFAISLLFYFVYQKLNFFFLLQFDSVFCFYELCDEWTPHTHKQFSCNFLCNINLKIHCNFRRAIFYFLLCLRNCELSTG